VKGFARLIPARTGLVRVVPALSSYSCGLPHFLAAEDSSNKRIVRGYTPAFSMILDKLSQSSRIFRLGTGCCKGLTPADKEYQS
jgi:hypothetical protein